MSFVSRFSCVLVPVLLGLSHGVGAQLIITGVIDGDLPGGTPKGVELYAIEDIADLSVFGVGSANNGGGSDGVEFTFPADSLNAGDSVYVGSKEDGWMDVFGKLPDYISGALSINGDDAVELFKNDSVIDVFGDINTDGTDTSWEYTDSFAYRVNRTGPDGAIFTETHWTIPGAKTLDGLSGSEQAAEVAKYFGFYTDSGEDPLALSMTVGPRSVPEDAGFGAATLTLFLNRALDENLSVNISIEGGDTTEISLQPSAVFGAGETEIVVMIEALNDGILDGDVDVLINAEAEGAVPASVILTVTDVVVPPEIVINEIYPDTRSGDPNNDGESTFGDEFVEVLNLTGATVDLSGWSLTTFGNSAEPVVRHVFPAGTELAHEESVVIFQEIDVDGLTASDFGGAEVQAASTGIIFLGNDSDTVTLLDTNDGPVSVFRYSNNHGNDGVSLTRFPDGDGAQVLHSETDDGLDYSPGTRTTGQAFAGAANALRISFEDEFVVEPNDEGFPSSIEGMVTRVTGQSFDQPLEVTLLSSDESQAKPTVATVTIPGGELSAVFHLEAVEDGTADGDVDVAITASADAYVSGEASMRVVDVQIDLLRFDGVVSEIAENGATELALVAYGLVSGEPLVLPGDLAVSVASSAPNILKVPETVTILKEASSVLIPIEGVPDNVPGPDQAVTITASAAGFRNIEIVITVRNVDAPLWVLNEFLADPGSDGDANMDGVPNASEDEFVEFVNNSDTPQDISGWIVSDAVTVRHTFPDGSIVSAGGAVVVFGGGQPTGSFGGALVQVADPPQLGLNNSGDTITLADANGDTIVDYEYGSEGGNDQSLARSPDLIGDFLEHSLIEAALNAPFSPGLKLDGSPFAPNSVDESLRTWLEAHFGENRNDPDIAGLHADPDGDYLANLLEYALDRDPTSRDLPAVELDFLQTADGSVLTYLRPVSTPTGVVTVLQGAPDLAGSTWVDIPDSNLITSTEDLGNGFERLRIALGGAAANKALYFLRISGRISK